MFTRQLNNQSKTMRSAIGLVTALALIFTSVGTSTGDLLANTLTFQPDAGKSAALPTANFVAAGGNHACATLNTGEVRCWGNNSHGQLGIISTTNTSNIPTALHDFNDRNATIEAGKNHTCLLLNGSIKCFGSNTSGQLGVNIFITESVVPIDTTNMTSGVSDFSAGDFHTCGVKGGLAYCWGANNYGQLGNGEPLNYAEGTFREVTVVEVISNIVSISAGANHTCSTLQNGSAYCWGNDAWGQLGIETSNCCDVSINPTPTIVVGLTSGVKYVAAGTDHSCALMVDSTVKCWGANNFGQLGLGNSNGTVVPTTVPGLTNVVNIVLGYSHTCALLKDGKVKCWGNYDTGQISSYAINYSNVPLEVSGLNNVVQLTTGDNHICARISDGSVKCWGNNIHGQLGRGNTLTANNVNDHIAGLSGEIIRSLDIGYEHSCVTTTNGQIKCWGDNKNGQLGDGTTQSRQIAVPLFGNLLNFSQVATGDYFSCGLTQLGAVYCWGSKVWDPIEDSDHIPTVTSGALPATAIAAGQFHACLVTTDMTAQCWGSNDSGQLGNGTSSKQDSPVNVNGLTNVNKISGGGAFNCAITHDGVAKCWGTNKYGNLGVSPAISVSTVPTDVVGLNNLIEIAAGDTHACAINYIGDVYCWGDNRFGQTGDVTTNKISSPIKVQGLPAKATSIAAGSANTCVVLVSGQGYCWGANSDYNRNGITRQAGSPDNTPSPITINPHTISSLKLGTSHTCALGTNGTVTCWGYFYTGLLAYNYSFLEPQYVLNIGGAQLAMPLIIKN